MSFFSRSARRQPTGATSGGTLLVPVLVQAAGQATGLAITTTAAGLALLVDSASSETAPLPRTGFTTLGTQNTNSAGALSIWVGWKFVGLGEVIQAHSASGSGSSRRLLRIYDSVDPLIPIHAFATFGEHSAAAVVPPLTIGAGGRLVVGFVKRAGTGVPAWAAPVDQNPNSVATSGSISAAESAGVLTSYAGQNISVGSNDWCSASIALNGDIA